MSAVSLAVASLVSVLGLGGADPAASQTRSVDGGEASEPRPSVEVESEVDGSHTRGGRMPTGMRRYLTRELQFSSRFLDHGVLGVAIAGGYPHLYRVELAMGFLDHVTLGVTAHWLPGQSVPQWAPKAALAFWRGRGFEVGATYHQALYRPPVVDIDPNTPSFQERDHWILSTVSFSHLWLSGGFDIGVVRGIEKHPGIEPPDPMTNASIVRWRAGGGLHLRAGTRRWGFTANFLAPRIYAELAFDLRFGLFEARPRGGWKPEGVVYSTDRRVPRWR
jgi:hypothetical protein